MDVKEAVRKRRAYRSLEHTEIADEVVEDLATHAGLSASCFNNQPWRFVFVRDAEVLEKMRTALSRGNEWVHNASMIIAVTSRKDLDCVVKDRDYYLFDTGMATAFLILRATELGLVAHPIAGFKQKKAKKILKIPPEMTLIALVIVGAHKKPPVPGLSEQQLQAENARPERLDVKKYAFMDTFSGDSNDNEA